MTKIPAPKFLSLLGAGCEDVEFHIASWPQNNVDAMTVCGYMVRCCCSSFRSVTDLLCFGCSHDYDLGYSAFCLIARCDSWERPPQASILVILTFNSNLRLNSALLDNSEKDFHGHYSPVHAIAQLPLVGHPLLKWDIAYVARTELGSERKG